MQPDAWRLSGLEVVCLTGKNPEKQKQPQNEKNVKLSDVQKYNREVW